MVKSLKYIVLLFAFATLTMAQSANPDSLVSIANNAYNHGLYDSALVVYDQVVNEGYEFG